MKGDSVEVTVGKLYANSSTKAQMIVTPMLKWDNGSVNLDKLTTR